jgi:hypothetical protein
MFASITHIPSLHKILSNMPKHKLTITVRHGVYLFLRQQFHLAAFVMHPLALIWQVLIYYAENARYTAVYFCKVCSPTAKVASTLCTPDQTLRCCMTFTCTT